MSSRALSHLRRTLSVRLVLWYSGLFILSSIVLFVAAVLLVSATFRGYDHQILLARIHEYSQIARSENTAALAARIRSNEETQQDSAIFIRLADPANRSLVTIVPGHWSASEARALESTAAPAGREQWEATVRRERGDDLVMIGRRLSDGSILQAAKRPEVRGRLLESFPKLFAGILVPVIALGIAGGLFLSVRALRPIRDLIDTVQTVAAGRMDARVPSRQTGDELDELVQLFNGMLSRIECLINGMREALDNVAHDLRTPITRLRNVIETAVQSDAGEEGLREALMDTAEEAERINTALDTLMDISVAERGIMELRWETADLVPVIRQVVDLYQDAAEDKGVAIKAALPDACPIRMDPRRIRQVVANLVDNALKFTPSGGRVDITAVTEGGGARVIVADTGAGITEKDLPRIFERLYRGDQGRSHRVLGLGLSIVQAVVRAHTGSIEVRSAGPGHGAVFEVVLPASPSAVNPGACLPGGSSAA